MSIEIDNQDIRRSEIMLNNSKVCDITVLKKVFAAVCRNDATIVVVLRIVGK